MDSKVTNELNNLFNKDTLSGTERTKIIAICNTLCHDGSLLSEIKNAITPVVEKEGFNIEKNISGVVSCIISIFTQVEFYKEVQTDRMKYIIYCLLISVLLKEYPKILEKVEIGTLRDLYDSVFEIVLIIPQTVKIAKSGCLTCLGKTRVFSFLNKNKLVIQ